MDVHTSFEIAPLGGDRTDMKLEGVVVPVADVDRATPRRDGGFMNEPWR